MKDWNWLDDALCAGSDVDFFSEEPDEVQRAKDICAQCPVRMFCLKSALDNEDRFGVWGGADEGQIRQALGIDQYGKPYPRERPLTCPYCGGEDVSISENKRTSRQLECSVCGLTWWARKPASLVKIEAEEETNDEEE